jgi:starch synthase
MQVVLATSGKFHTFDLARQMHQRGMLRAIYTGYPCFKLRNEALPSSLIHSFPFFCLAFNVAGRVTQSQRIIRDLVWRSLDTVDRYACAILPPCDVFVGLSCSGLYTGQKAQRRGGVYICDRGSSHIRFQDQILVEEYARHRQSFIGVDPRVVSKEEREYAAADMITVPSTFVKRSFLTMGVAESKLRVIPYGVSLTRFHPVGEPDPDYFDVLFVGAASVRKGVRYLLEGFEALAHPRKRLTFVGAVLPEIKPLIAEFGQRLPITCRGHVPQPALKEIMSRSHVLVMPSIEEGLALVQAQAMACGCPVIGTTNSGAEDLLRDGVEGFVAPIRDAGAIAERLQRLADDPSLRLRMSQACLTRVQSFGGWDQYGDQMAALFSELCGMQSHSPPPLRLDAEPDHFATRGEDALAQKGET